MNFLHRPLLCVKGLKKVCWWPFPAGWRWLVVFFSRLGLYQLVGIPVQRTCAASPWLVVLLSRPALRHLSINRTVDVTHSSFIHLTGDLMGPALNVEGLLRLPYGCGEQNMVNFAPSIYIMKYLSTVGQLTHLVENKAKNIMTIGTL